LAISERIFYFTFYFFTCQLIHVICINYYLPTVAH
jgi:hypothetical protein